jgi:hypothetical protein
MAAFTALLMFGAGGSDFVSGVEAVIGAKVPEPETWAMLLAGLGLVWRRARRVTTADFFSSPCNSPGMPPASVLIM